MIRCEDLFAALIEYVDGELDAETSAMIERHLEECPACELVVDNIRRTISVYAADASVDVPAALHEHLDGLLRGHWAAKFSGHGTG
ncbi:MAG TPA: zf-HC2 domain-containing protein [Thermoguttaceae bacterium]|nr:zf-HC2 domain-containing protein [Thermoguttaceae bacterium]